VLPGPGEDERRVGEEGRFGATAIGTSRAVKHLEAAEAARTPSEEVITALATGTTTEARTGTARSETSKRLLTRGVRTAVAEERAEEKRERELPARTSSRNWRTSSRTIARSSSP
jgi:hypothetical protein